MSRYSFPFSPKILELFGKSHPKYSLSEEVLAGITVGLIAFPMALALGIASIPSGTVTPISAPALGIFTAIIGGLVVSLIGGSRVQIGGPTAAFVPLILLIVSQHGYIGLLVATIMAGVIQLIMGLARLGTLIKYIPWPVTSGFTTGIAVSIMITEVPDFFGFRSTHPMPHEFFEKLPWLWNEFCSMNPHALLVAAASIAVILLWPKFKLHHVPAVIVAILGATLLVALLGWGATHGVATIGRKFGPNAIPSALPIPHFPHFDWHILRNLIGPATAIALLGAIESLLSAVVADGLTGERHNSNTELIAQGVSNILCPLFGGIPSTGALPRTSANVNSGARTPLSGIIHALILLGIILVASKWATFIPMGAMAAVMIAVSVRMGEWHELVRLHRMPRSDALVLMTTLGLTVLFDLVVAIEIGMVLAAILFIKSVSESTEVSRVTDGDMLERPEHVARGKKIPEGVVVYRVFGPFLFGAAEKMEDALEEVGELPKVLILRLNLVPAMDATGLNVLESIVERIRAKNGTVILSGIHRQPQEILSNAGFDAVIGRENFCATFDDALMRASRLIVS